MATRVARGPGAGLDGEGVDEQVRVLPGMTLLLGVIGSIVGGVVANVLGTGEVFELNIIGSAVAIVTAVVLVVAGERAGASDAAYPVGEDADSGRITSTPEWRAVRP